MLSREKPLAKQSIICLISVLGLHDLGWHFFLDLQDMLGLALL